MNLIIQILNNLWELQPSWSVELLQLRVSKVFQINTCVHGDFCVWSILSTFHDLFLKLAGNMPYLLYIIKECLYIILIDNVKYLLMVLLSRVTY